ncbi:MAG TPA: zinc ribbon domain-containing protein [Longimicrobium sp.]|nr:zinc ribbon domain-containing protein [Longimicrobium sp.]
MLMLIQAGPAEVALMPWWVMYVAVIALTYAVFAMARRTGWAVPLGCLSFFVLMGVGALSLPGNLSLLMLALAALPFIGSLVGSRGRAPAARGAAGVAPGPRAIGRVPQQPLMAGQPRPDAVLRSKAMAERFAAGMPRDAGYLARMRYVRGIGEMTDRPVDLFTGGGQLWVAPLKADVPPVPIPARNVLRVDVWPEPEGPPTLRVSWSPPAGDLTAELVLEAMPNVPPEMVTPQLQTLSGVLTTAIAAEARKAETAEDAAMVPLSALRPGTLQPMTMPPPPPPVPHACPTCGEPVPPGARACPRCATPV